MNQKDHNIFKGHLRHARGGSKRAERTIEKTGADGERIGKIKDGGNIYLIEILFLYFTQITITILSSHLGDHQLLRAYIDSI